MHMLFMRKILMMLKLCRTPLEQVTGETPDISEYLDFSFYDRIWYRDYAGVDDNMF